MFRCNQCGRPIKKASDKEPPLIIKHSFGYFTKRDLDKLNVTLCPDCTEDLTQHLIAKCTINPIVESVVI